MDTNAVDLSQEEIIKKNIEENERTGRIAQDMIQDKVKDSRELFQRTRRIVNNILR